MEEQAAHAIFEIRHDKINDFIRELEDRNDTDLIELIEFLKSII